VNSLAIEVLAATVANTYKLKLPVDLEKVCCEEGIELAPGEYSPKFHGRIEFHPEDGVFILFYPIPRPGLSLGRIRFSICHELGHYFIEEHRDLIVSGKVHNSLEPFKPAKNRIEDEADQFASALLIPEKRLRAYMGSRAELPLDAILQLADFAKASIQATAFRYVTLANEPCVVVISKGGHVLRSYASTRAADMGFSWLGNTWVPDNSTAITCLKAEPYVVTDGATNTGLWFSERNYGGRLWEESARLGLTNYAITMLSWPEEKID
jgi:hypothetical protein